MNIAKRKGVGFGLTSGVITTLGLMTGLASSTGSKIVVISGIITIAVADAFSDSLGVHISEESGSKRIKEKEIWESTFATFISKLVVALTFLIPVLVFNLITALLISMIWGILLIILFSAYISKKHGINPWRAIGEHVLIAVVVLFATYFLGKWISSVF